MYEKMICMRLIFSITTFTFMTSFWICKYLCALKDSLIFLFVSLLILFLYFLTWVLIITKLLTLHGINYTLYILFRLLTFFKSSGCCSFGVKRKILGNVTIARLSHSVVRPCVCLCLLWVHQTSGTIMPIDVDPKLVYVFLE